MAIDPHPGQPNEDWDDFVTGHIDLGKAPEAAHTSPLPAQLADLDVEGLTRLVAASQQITGQITAGNHPRVPLWARGQTAKVGYWTVAAPTLVSGLANVSAHQWPGWEVPVTGGAVMVFALFATVAGLNRHWNPAATVVTSAITVGGLQFATAAGSGGWMEVVAWLTGAVGTMAFAVLWNRKHEEDKAKAELVRAKTATEHAKRDSVQVMTQVKAAHELLKIQHTRAQAVPERPYLGGTTGEERALRTAMRETTGTVPLYVDVTAEATGWSALIDLPASLPRKEFRTAWHKVESALAMEGFFQVSDAKQSNRVKVRYANGHAINQVIAYRQPAPDTAWDAPIHLGVDVYGHDVSISLAATHALIAGATRSGKSVMCRNIICQLAARPDVALIGVDMKEGLELLPFGDLFDAVVDDIEGAHRVLDWTYEEIKRRADILKACGEQAWDPARHGAPAVYVFFDEIAELEREDDSKGNDRATVKLTSLLQRGAALGLHVVVAGQAPSANALGGSTDARGQFMVRACHRVTEATVAGFMFGAGTTYDPKAITDKGVFLLWDQDHTEPVPMKGAFLDGPAFKTEVDRIAGYKQSGRLGIIAGDLTPEDKVRMYLDANPGASQRAVAEGTGVPRTSVQDILRRL